MEREGWSSWFECVFLKKQCLYARFKLIQNQTLAQTPRHWWFPFFPDQGIDLVGGVFGGVFSEMQLKILLRPRQIQNHNFLPNFIRQPLRQGFNVIYRIQNHRIIQELHV